MPLLDHFHPPWLKQRPWDSFHAAWANALAEQLNDGVLPPSFVALPLTHQGGRIEIDVATLNGTTGTRSRYGHGGLGAVAADSGSTD